MINLDFVKIACVSQRDHPVVSWQHIHVSFRGRRASQEHAGAIGLLDGPDLPCLLKHELSKYQLVQSPGHAISHEHSARDYS